MRKAGNSLVSRLNQLVRWIVAVMAAELEPLRAFLSFDVAGQLGRPRHYVLDICKVTLEISSAQLTGGPVCAQPKWACVGVLADSKPKFYKEFPAQRRFLTIPFLLGLLVELAKFPFSPLRRTAPRRPATSANVVFSPP
jgi:hypothetical protein